MKKKHCILTIYSILFFTFSCVTHRKITFQKSDKKETVKPTNSIEKNYLAKNQVDPNKNYSVYKIEPEYNTENALIEEGRDSSVTNFKNNQVRLKTSLPALFSDINIEIKSDKTVHQKKNAIQKKVWSNLKEGETVSVLFVFLIIVLLLILIFALYVIILLNSAINSSSNGNGCYIATMAYGNHDAPAVLSLRKFRDKYLEKKAFGRKFIAWYYKKSPNFVARHQSKTWLHFICRGYLNVLVFILRIFFKIQ